MANIYAGYMGMADFTALTSPLRFNDCSIVAKQEINAPEMVMGDWDRDAYNYGAIDVSGSISGPVTENFGAAGGLFDWATTRDSCGLLTESDLTIYYYCGGSGNRSRQFNGVYVNSLNFSCAAGDVANFSIDVMGASAEPWGGDSPGYTTAEKILTWDKVTVVPAGLTAVAYSNFDFTISNNCTPAYSLGQTNLFPYEIVPGIRSITGSISVYNIPDANGADTWDDYTAAGTNTLTFNIGVASISFEVQYHRVEPASSVGPLISTVAFTGVTHQTF